MNSKTTIKKLTLGSLALAAVAGAGLAFTPNSAHADTSSRSGVGVLKSMDGGRTWADGRQLDGFIVTFDRPIDPASADGVAKLATGQLVLPSQDSYDGSGSTGALLNTSGDNTWAGAATGTFRLTFNGQTTGSVFGEPVTFTATVAPVGGKGGGKVEFEWKVEEGES